MQPSSSSPHTQSIASPQQCCPHAGMDRTSPTQGGTSSRRTANNSAHRYYSRDVASDPPTPIVVVRELSDLDPSDPHSRFFVLESDLEPTEGWNTRQQKSQLSVCFMHSFGKCLGRYQNDPSTCHQLHVKQSVMESLRSRYQHPVRRFFSRTIKARLQPELLSVIAQVARKELTLQYLEYLAHDVRETEGLHKYEKSYRTWLSAPGGFQHAFHETSVPQCTDYALRGTCMMDRQCPAVHAHLSRAQVRDSIVMNALRTISAPHDHASGSASPANDHSDSSHRVSPALSPRYSRAGSQPSFTGGVVSGQVSPNSTHLQYHTGQHQHAAPPYHAMHHHQQQQPSGAPPTYVQLASGPGQFSNLPPGSFVQSTTSPNHFDGAQYIPVSQQAHSTTTQPNQPMFVVVMPQQGGGGGGALSGAPSSSASPQQFHLQPSAFHNTLLLPSYQPLESSNRSTVGVSDDYQVRLDLGTLSGQTSPHSFVSGGGGDAFGQQRSRSPNPHYQAPPQHATMQQMQQHSIHPQQQQQQRQIFPLSLNATGSLWAPQQQPPPQPQQPQQAFIPSVYRVDQASGFLVLEQQQPP